MSVNLPKQLLPNISSELRSELENNGNLKKFVAGDVVLKENAHIRSIPIVISGSLKVLQEDEHGKELFLYYVKTGESCVMSLFGGLHHDVSKIKAIADEDSELLLLPVDPLSEWIKQFPDWLEFVLSLYHKRFEELLEVINSIAFKKIDQRLLELLHQKSKHYKNKTIQITHEQLANELGTARVVVSRLLKQMEDDDLIVLGRNKISLV
jgi:CRP/FNR family transcriptional regulator